MDIYFKNKKQKQTFFQKLYILFLNTILTLTYIDQIGNMAQVLELGYMQ